MPIFEYKCATCASTYDVYHKVREVNDDVVCPSCGSQDHKRLMSTTQVSMGNSGYSPAPSCESGGGCCGGSCSVN